MYLWTASRKLLIETCERRIDSVAPMSMQVGIAPLGRSCRGVLLDGEIAAPERYR
jgi:hypothetical protein